ncbi:MAG: hypothetical protein Q4C75_03565, partial [Bergeyella zoohelcum]|nr:hypothetical protein [Bergeyella zoohelcum]
FLALAFLFLSELYRAFKSKTDWKHFGLSSGILAVAFVLGIGMNSQRILANSEYVKETTRGKQILNENGQKSGLDRESITAWSYGKLETLNLFIPRLMGGGSDEPEAEKMMEQVQQMVQDNVQSQQEMDAISKGFNSLTYWGDQPMTSGPAYQGAVVVFLAILGFFFAENKYRYWVLGASILTILLAWGHHFAPLTDFFIDVVPFYNKFRAPSSILVIVELLFPFIAILGLYQFYQSDKIAKEQKTKTLLYVSASVLGITLLLLVFGKGLLGFYTDTEKQYLPPYLLDFLVGERYKMFQEDAIKAVVYVAITAGVLLASLKGKLHQNIALLVIGLVSLLDLWSVNQRYLNSSNFVDKTFAENPFITENSDYLADKASQNTYIAGLLSQTEINKTLQEIADKDKAHYRIYNQALGAFNETNTSYFKSSIGGYSAAKLRRYDDIINHYFYNNMDSVKTPKVLNMLNAKYMIFGGSEGVQEVPNPSANGNAWLVSDVKWVQTPNEEIRAIGEVDTKKTAVILKKEFEKEMKNAKFSADSTATIDLKTYQPNELVYQSQSQTPQLAVFSEIYYPYGWKIFIDGTEQPLIRANYLLRSAIIPAGKHEIKMIFQPEVIEKGKLYSLLSFGLFLILSGLGFFLVRKKEQNG